MELKLEINEAKFREILEKELSAFTEEELHEICRKALIQQMSDPSIFKGLFLKETKNSYWSSEGFSANDVLKTAASTINFEETFQELQDGIVNYIKEHHMEILHEMVINMFINGLSYNVVNNTEFYDKLKLELCNK